LQYYEEALKDIARAMVYKESIVPYGHYKIAAIYALQQNKNLMLLHLNKCMAQKYFTDKENFEKFLADEDFSNYKTDKELLAFKDKIRKQLK
jgi:hypothetical protein